MFRERRVMRRRGLAGTRRADSGPHEAPEADEVAPAPEPPPAPPGQMKELSELREQGILTEEEFAAEKRKQLGI